MPSPTQYGGGDTSQSRDYSPDAHTRKRNVVTNDGSTPSSVTALDYLEKQRDDRLPATAPSDNGCLRPNTAVPAPKRFSLMRFRHFSDTQLFTKAKMQQQQHTSDDAPAGVLNASYPPPIITSAPRTDGDLLDLKKRSGKAATLSLRGTPSTLTQTQSHRPHLSDGLGPDSASVSRPQSSSLLPWRRSTDQRRPVLPVPGRLSLALTSNQHHSTSELSVPLDNASHIDDDAVRSAGDRLINRRGFFRSKNRKSLFPLPPKPQVVTPPQTAPVSPRVSMSALSSAAEHACSVSNFDGNASSIEDHAPTPTNPDSARTRSAVSFAAPAVPLLRNTSSHSVPCSRSPPSVPTATLRTTTRDRTSTMSTFPRVSDDMTPPPTLSGSARNSISTSGRTSLGGLLTFNRFRHGSDTNGSRHASPGPHSKSNSFAISRELQAPPSRHDDESAANYLERLRNIVPRGTIAATLSQSSDPFLQTVLRSYTRKLSFFGEPVDMSLRKFLLEAELPKETVHVDRVIQAFADRYHECNPGIFMSPDEAYVIAFSLMILHTDAFNKNNKHKMTKEDYIKNARGQHVAEQILACFYENICYTPFIHFDEDDYETGADKLFAMRSRKLKLKNAPQGQRRPAGPVDPYSLIIESKLDQLRPSIKTSINLEDPYTYMGTLKSLNSSSIQSAITNTGVLEIISSRSRPAAFETQATRDNPYESRPGVVQIQVTKVGLLWRKNAKRKKTRSPWQEWGAILTGSQLYFVRNLGWIKNLMNQLQAHKKAGNKTAVIFKPSLEEFKPDALTKTYDAVALLDRSYNKHKNAFQLLRAGGEEEVFLAESESELNEWISLINYTAAFGYAGVAVRGFLDNRLSASQEPRVLRINSSATTATVHSAREQTQGQTMGPYMDPRAMLQVMAARRKIMIVRIAEAEIALAEMNRKLDEMLRNARHLQILAPIQPRTREGVIHAAARIDAMLKWSRRDIWRTRCYKDILSMDALEDSDDVVNASAQIQPIIHTPAGDKSAALKPPDQADIPPRSDIPLQTPKRAIESTQNRSKGSPSEHDTLFKTPPETRLAMPVVARGSWESLAATNTVSSAARPESLISASASTASRRPSVAPVSSTTSLQESDGLVPSPALNGSRPAPRTPIPSARDPAVSNAAGTTHSAASSAGRHVNDSKGVTPDSAAGKARHRMSLHRSFRETGPDHASRHRRARDSASTIRSETAHSDRVDDSSTTGLERGRGSFMVHGKQASVITFGGDWTDDKMRIRREGDRTGRTVAEHDDTPRAGPRRTSDGTDAGSGVDSNISEAALRLQQQIELAERYVHDSPDVTITARDHATAESETASVGGGNEFFDAPEPAEDDKSPPADTGRPKSRKDEGRGAVSETAV